MIEIRNITKSYGEKTVVEDVSIALPTGKITAFIGSNGAGKSTILSLVSRLIAANEGEVCIDGVSLAQWNTRELAKHLAILGQSTHFNLRITVEDLVRFGRFPHSQGKLDEADQEIIDEALSYTGLHDLKGRFIDELSGGQQQMAYIAMAIAQNTKYILLDEPLNNLDMRRSAQIMSLLRRLVHEKGKTVIVVIHDINFVSFYADFIVALKDGKLRHSGPVSEIIKPDVLKDIYDMDIVVEDYNGKPLCVYYE
ncbi:ATP-binding cassette domain-containing protein [Microvirga sp. W0021]|uniref:ATP-binding cassette domain-containing protein n=1 Tax=Hohaiivirga grylli TaxID=3133970 RepID=A0ABV0BJL8_9HYPH